MRDYNMVDGYKDDDMLLLSGIQHFVFCERQWALIHMEQQWEENVRTVEGKHIHERADNPFESETRGGMRISRSMPLISRKLGLQGVADVVEFIRDGEAPEEETVMLEGRSGRWRVRPVEYKRGKPKKDDRDIVQLCAQALALEEMLGVVIPGGCLYYHEIRHRSEVVFDGDLRSRVKELAAQMHEMMDHGVVPKAKKQKHCSLCSLVEICQPGWNKTGSSVEKYLKRLWEEEDGA